MTESEIDAAKKICESRDALRKFANSNEYHGVLIRMADSLPRALDALSEANRRIAELEEQLRDTEEMLNIVVECTSRDTTKEPNP